MKRFDFPLERVRQWRHEQAAVEEQKLQKLYTKLLAVDDARKRIEAEVEAAILAIRELPDSNPADRANLDNYREYSRQLLLRNSQNRLEIEGQIAKQRQAVIEARRSFELLDRLKQKAWAEWIAARDKEQEELAAELYLAKRRRGFPTSEMQ
jgi:membrane-bound lytic murein transglycosylase MltF